MAVAELGPERLRGYGPLDADNQAQARKVKQELTRLMERIAAYLRQGVGRDLAQRLARLEAEPASLQTLNFWSGSSRAGERWADDGHRSAKLVRRFARTGETHLTIVGVIMRSGRQPGPVMGEQGDIKPGCRLENRS